MSALLGTSAPSISTAGQASETRPTSNPNDYDVPGWPPRPAPLLPDNPNDYDVPGWPPQPSIEPYPQVIANPPNSVVVRPDTLGNDVEVSVDVPVGQDLVLDLTSNASTGYEWEVISTDRSFGYPEETYLASSAPFADGSPGTQRFTWKTESPHVREGTGHFVTLQYKRPWQDEPIKTVRLHVNLVAAVPAQSPIQGPGGVVDADGQSVGAGPAMVALRAT